VQIYRKYFVPPNVLPSFCYLQFAFYIVVAHTPAFLTIPYFYTRNEWKMKLVDAGFPASRRRNHYVATQDLLRGDVGKNLC